MESRPRLIETHSPWVVTESLTAARRIILRAVALVGPHRRAPDQQRHQRHQQVGGDRAGP